MNSSFALRLAALLLVALHLLPPALHAQGPLTPPGAPAPTMKTLAQIEARTPIDPTQPGFALPYTISQAGSYYLTGNLNVAAGDAIQITASGVTLDLSGFTISSSAFTAAGAGISLSASGLRDIAIINGHIRGSVTNNGGVYGGGGFNSGIQALSGSARSVLISNISVSGCLGNGIIVGSAVLESCLVRTVGGSGIVAGMIKNCSATDCGLNGIQGEGVSHCYGSGENQGIAARMVENSYGFSGDGTGISADTVTNSLGFGFGAGSSGLTATSALNSYGSSNSGSGLRASHAQNCSGSGSSGGGLVASTAQNCEGSSNAGVGLTAETAINCVGWSGSSTGLVASWAASNCSGTSTSGIGLDVQAGIATACYGVTSTGAAGIRGVLVKACRGKATGSGGGAGIYASNASDCYGESVNGIGLDVQYGNATNSTGVSTSGPYGLRAGSTASHCIGYRSGGIGLSAFIAIGCSNGSTGGGGSISSPHSINSFVIP